MNIHSHGDVLRRREEIVTIAREQAVHSQEELLHALRRSGFRVTQPTLSRDIAAIGLIKTPSGYVVPGDLAPVTQIAAWPDRFESAVRELVRSAAAAQNLVVIRPFGPAARRDVSAFDSCELGLVLGTIRSAARAFLALA